MDFQCISCKKIFRADEGVFQGLNNTDFLCDGCVKIQRLLLARGARKRQDEEKEKQERQQALELAQQAKQAEILNQQKFHNDYSLGVSEIEALKLPNFPRIDNVRVGFYGEIKPCSGYIIKYGENGATPTKIYLTFNYSTNSQESYYSNYKVNYVYNNQIKNFCARCSQEILNNWWSNINYDYYQQTQQAEKELENIKERIREREKKAFNKVN
jgi:hypothetical protein